MVHSPAPPAAAVAVGLVAAPAPLTPALQLQSEHLWFMCAPYTALVLHSSIWNAVCTVALRAMGKWPARALRLAAGGKAGADA